MGTLLSAHAKHVTAQVNLLAEAVVVAVVAVAPHLVMVVQSVEVMVFTGYVAVPPDKYDVESVIFSVQCGIAVLPVHDDRLVDEVNEDCPGKDGSDCDADLEKSSFFCRLPPISARVSVRVLISAMDGTAPRQPSPSCRQPVRRN